VADEVACARRELSAADTRGLARGTLEAVDIVDAAGYDMVLIETVGVGQDEVDVARASHTTVVVSAPGLGDDIQAIKAGVLDPARVTRSALQNAASIAGLLLTTDCAITEIKEKKAKEPKKAAEKKPARKKVVKETRMKAYWGVFNQAMKRLAMFEYADKKAAEKKK